MLIYLVKLSYIGQKNFKSDFLRFSIGKKGQTTRIQMCISLQPHDFDQGII